MAPGGRLPSGRSCARSIASEAASASPVAVPPAGVMAVRSACRSVARSVVGLCTASARWLKTTPPTRTLSGTSSRKASPARRAATRREGVTSVASIEPERSMVSTIDACSAGTATLTCGRASAVMSPAIAMPASRKGACRRQPGRRGTTDGAVADAANAASPRRRRRSAPAYATAQSGRRRRPSSSSGAWKLTAPAPAVR
jgi:hypothetical protein